MIGYMVRTEALCIVRTTAGAKLLTGSQVKLRDATKIEILFQICLRCPRSPFECQWVKSFLYLLQAGARETFIELQQMRLQLSGGIFS